MSGERWWSLNRLLIPVDPQAAIMGICQSIGQRLRRAYASVAGVLDRHVAAQKVYGVTAWTAPLKPQPVAVNGRRLIPFNPLVTE
jgi:hypothetical protein